MTNSLLISQDTLPDLPFLCKEHVNNGIWFLFALTDDKYILYMGKQKMLLGSTGAPIEITDACATGKRAVYFNDIPFPPSLSTLFNEEK